MWPNWPKLASVAQKTCTFNTLIPRVKYVLAYKCYLSPNSSFVTFFFEPFKLITLYFAQYSIYYFEIFTYDMNDIDFLFNNIKLNTFNNYVFAAKCSLGDSSSIRFKKLIYIFKYGVHLDSRLKVI